jgi:hypothetical protein
MNKTLTSDQKANLAAWLIYKAAEMLPFDMQGAHHEDWLGDLDYDAALAQLGVWLKRLPGDYWHSSLNGLD